MRCLWAIWHLYTVISHLYTAVDKFNYKMCCKKKMLSFLFLDLLGINSPHPLLTLGTELKVLPMLGMYSTTKLSPQPSVSSLTLYTYILCSSAKFPSNWWSQFNFWRHKEELFKIHFKNIP